MSNYQFKHYTFLNVSRKLCSFFLFRIKLFYLNSSDETSTNSNEKDYLQSVFMPATQAGFSVFMQIMWSWKLGQVIVCFLKKFKDLNRKKKLIVFLQGLDLTVI